MDELNRLSRSRRHALIDEAVAASRVMRVDSAMDIAALTRLIRAVEKV